ARDINMELVEHALRMASEEVAAAAQLTETEAARTLFLAWMALGVFVVVGLTSGLLLSRAVRTIAARFEKAAAEVTRQRDHLQAVMTAMQDALIVVDASGIITTVNAAAYRLLGCERGGLVGGAIDRFVQPAPEAPADPGGLPRPHTHTATDRTPDGDEIPISVSAATLRDE